MKPEKLQSNIKWVRLSGALIFAASLYFALFAFNLDHNEAFGLGLLIFPFLVGIFVPLVVDPRGELTGWDTFWIVMIVYVVLAGILVAAGRESAFCLIIGAPIFLLVSVWGMLISRAITTSNLDTNTPKSYALIAAIPVILAPIEMPHNFSASQHTVTNAVTIAATPAQVWGQITSFAPIRDDERIWAFSHNVLGGPVPIRSEIEGNTRHAYWTMSVLYEERIKSKDDAHMAWDIHFADDFQMDGYDKHIHPNSTQFRLQSGRYDVAYDGVQTTLTLRTDYQLRTLYNPYIALWGQLFLGDNHRAILHVIKTRAEAS